MGNLTDKAIESLCFGPIQAGQRKGQYRKYRIEGTEWNTDNDAMAENGKMKSKYGDGGSMYILLAKSGSKLWRVDYSFPRGGKRKTLSLGSYPSTGLAEAREKLLEVKKLLAQGIDPSQDRKEKTEVAKREQSKEQDTFERIAREWHSLKMSGLQSSQRSLSVFERDVFPYIGSKAIAEVTRDDVLNVLRKIESRGALAKFTYQIINRVFEYCLILGKVQYNVAHGLSDVLQSRPVKHYSHITEAKTLGLFLRDMESESAINTFSQEIRQYLRILPYVFTRPIELAAAKWTEIDFDKDLWTVPAERMKKRRPHLVPISSQVAELFKELLPFTGSTEYVFFSARGAGGFINSRSLLTRLRCFEGECDYRKSAFSLHGFRSTASTMLHEMGYNTEWIEMQLAHVDRNTVRATYNSAEYLDDRRRMMQSWSDYLDQLKEGKS